MTTGPHDCTAEEYDIWQRTEDFIEDLYGTSAKSIKNEVSVRESCCSTD